jgi:O-antigen/teichoic acid export membrane protein
VSPRAVRLSDSRTGRLFQAVSSGAAARVFTGVINLLTLPLAVRYLGAERYGVWATITTTAVWINLLDLGIANTLTNEISRAFALGDKEAARRYFTNALFLTGVFAASVGLLFARFGRQVSWARILNVSADVSPIEVERTVFTAVALMLLALPCNLVNKLLAGYQELPRCFLANALGALASLAGLSLGIALHDSGYAAGCPLSKTVAVAEAFRHRFSFHEEVARLRLFVFLDSGCGRGCVQQRQRDRKSLPGCIAGHTL